MTARLDQLSFEEGLDVVARVALPIGLLKRAEGLGIPGVGEALAKIPPEVRQSLMPVLAGAGVGAGLGGLSSLWQPPERRKPVSRMLTGGLLGGLMGGAYPLARDMAKGFDPNQFAFKSNQPNRFGGIEQAQQAKEQLQGTISQQLQTPTKPTGGQPAKTPADFSVQSPTNAPVDNELVSKAVQEARHAASNPLGIHKGWENRTVTLPDGTQITAPMPLYDNPLSAEGTSEGVGKAVQDMTIGSGLDLTDAVPPAAGAAAYGLAGRDWGITDRDALRKLLMEKEPGGLKGFPEVQQSIRETYDRLLSAGVSEDQAQQALLAHGTGAIQNQQQKLTQSLLDANRNVNSATSDAQAIQAQGRPAGTALSQARNLTNTARETAENVGQASRKLQAGTPVNGRAISGKELGARGWMPSLTSKQTPLESIRQATPRKFNGLRGGVAGLGADLLARLILNKLQGEPQLPQ